MRRNPPPPMCFVAMPCGRRSPPGKKKPAIDFDRIYTFIQAAVEDGGLECIRADYDANGGFVQRPMYERLLVAEYVIADVTFGNPNVMYEVGVRHGSRARATLLICAEKFVDLLPFDIKPFRVLTYKLDKKGNLSKARGKILRQEITERLLQAVTNDLPPDNPILQVTASDSLGRVQHEKTDVFLARMRYASEIGKRVYTALNRESRTGRVSELRRIEKEILSGKGVVSQLHTALISLYLAYREEKAYAAMVALFKKLPRELQRTPVAVEQLALAVNRLAEKAVADGKPGKAKRLRRDALRRLHELAEQDWSSETYGIAGRIHKGQAESEEEATGAGSARGALERAIETYERGFRLDPRDYYPGVNAVTLRLRRGTPEDLKELDTLVPAVRFSVDRAAPPASEEERYWQEATKLELACADKDWERARDLLGKVLAIDVSSWMRETTISNLEIQKKTFVGDAVATSTLEEATEALKAVDPADQKGGD